MSTKISTQATSIVSSISDYIGEIIGGASSVHLENYGYMLNQLANLDPQYLDAVESNPRYNPSHQIIFMGLLSLAGRTDHVFKINKTQVLDALNTMTLPTVIRILKTVPHECADEFNLKFYADICANFTVAHARAMEDALGGDLFEYNQLFDKGELKYGVTEDGSVYVLGLGDSRLRRWDQLQFIKNEDLAGLGKMSPIGNVDIEKLYKMDLTF